MTRSRPRPDGQAPRPYRPVARSDEALRADDSPGALVELSDRYCDRAHDVAAAILGSEPAANDVIGDACCSLWGTLASTARPKPDTGTWLMGTVARLAVRARADGRGLPTPLSELDDVQCQIVALNRYGALGSRRIAQELELPADVVDLELATCGPLGHGPADD